MFFEGFKQINLLKLNKFQGLFDGFSLVDIEEESVADAFNLAKALDDIVDSFRESAVSDD